MNQRSKLEALALALSFTLFIISIFMAYSLGDLVVDTAATGSILVLIVIMAFFYVLQPLFLKWWRPLHLYMASFTLVFLVFLVVAFIAFPQFFMLLPSLVLFLIYYVLSIKDTGDLKVRVPTFFITLALMVVIGNIIGPANQPPGFPVTIESTSSMFVLIGLKVPLLEKFGVTVISTRINMILSPVELLLFFGIASLVSENYHEIITYLTGHRSLSSRVGIAVYGLTGALSCQCESFIALLPAVSILLIDEILVPMIFVSAALLAGTYILVSRLYKRKLFTTIFMPDKWNGMKTPRIAFVAFMLVSVPVIFTIGIYYSWQKSALFFFLSNMLMVLIGYIFMVELFRIIPYGVTSRRVSSGIAFLGTVIPVAWFLPFMTEAAFHSPAIYGAMTVSGFAGGVLLGTAYSLLNKNDRYVFNEYITVIFSLIPLTIFYITDRLQKAIWPSFTISGQTEFSIIAWLVMLPVMWYATHQALNNLAFIQGGTVHSRRHAGLSGKHSEE
ncbi:MAG: hypothetical protein QXN26_03170 [Thermoplasmataceae archaeon]